MNVLCRRSNLIRSYMLLIIALTPGLILANEGQKMLGLLNDIVVGFGLCMLLFLVFPFLIVIPNGRWRFIIYTIINMGILVFFLLNFGLDDFEIFNGYAIVILLVALNLLYAWGHFRKSKELTE